MSNFELNLYMIHQVVPFEGQEVCFIYWIIVAVWLVCFNALLLRVYYMYNISITSMSFSDSCSCCYCCFSTIISYCFCHEYYCLCLCSSSSSSVSYVSVLQPWLHGYQLLLFWMLLLLFFYIPPHHQQCVMCVCSAAMTTRVSEASNHQQPNSQPSISTLLYCKIRTLPKSQRSRGLSSYHKFIHKSWSNFIFRISTKHQLQISTKHQHKNNDQTSASKSWPILASGQSRPTAGKA